MLQEVVVSHIFYFHPETWGFTIYNLTNMFQIGWFNHQLEQPIPLLRPAAISTWYPKQPVFNGRLMISNRFLCMIWFIIQLKQLPIQNPYFWGEKVSTVDCLEFLRSGGGWPSSKGDFKGSKGSESFKGGRTKTKNPWCLW